MPLHIGVRDELVHTSDLVLDIDDLDVPGALTAPDHARGLAIFSPGDGRPWSSARDQEIARALHRCGVATLLIDLFADGHTAHAHPPFDLTLFSRRLRSVARWAAAEALPRPAPLGYFGADTGAAVALAAAAEEPDLVRAVVCESARPEFAMRWLSRVTCPTLLIVRAGDAAVLGANARAITRMAGARELAVLADAGRPSDDPGATADAARLTTGWFLDHFGA